MELDHIGKNSEIQPLGQDNIEYVNVRIVAATNRDLKVEVEQGRFRSDLYHRLTVYPITVAPLRDRFGDVELLAGYFIEQTRRKLGIKQLKASATAIRYLEQYDWPGNVRELEHVVNRAALKASARQRDSQIITIEQQDCGNLVRLNKDSSLKAISAMALAQPDDNNLAIGDKPSINLRAATERFQRELISTTLKEERGNWAAAARRLNTDRANLNRIAKRLNIKIVKMVK